MKSLLLCALLIGALGIGTSACQWNVIGSDPSASEMATGLEGRVLKGPMCPVARDDQSCPDQPFIAWFDVLDDEEKPVARFQTDEEGRFSVALKPGTYTLVPDDAAPIIQPLTQINIVTVQPDQITSVILTFDTGIR